MIRLLSIFSASLLFSTFLSAQGSYKRAINNNALIYDPNPNEYETAYWYGDVDQNGYATGSGRLVWYEQGRKVSEYVGNKAKGKWTTYEEVSRENWENRVSRTETGGGIREEMTSMAVSAQRLPIPESFARNGDRYPVLYGTYKGAYVRRGSGGSFEKVIPKTFYFFTDTGRGIVYYKESTVWPVYKMSLTRDENEQITFLRNPKMPYFGAQESAIREHGRVIMPSSEKSGMIVMRVSEIIPVEEAKAIREQIEKEKAQTGSLAEKQIFSTAVVALMAWGGYKIAQKTGSGYINALKEGQKAAERAGERGQVTVWVCSHCGKNLHLKTGENPADSNVSCTHTNPVWLGGGWNHDWKLSYDYMRK